MQRIYPIGDQGRHLASELKKSPVKVDGANIYQRGVALVFFIEASWPCEALALSDLGRAWLAKQGR